MRSILLVAAALGLCFSVRANIGETPEQVKARYGPPFREMDQNKLDKMMGVHSVFYTYKDFLVLVAYMNGASASELFKRKGGPITEAEVPALLSTMGEGEWKKTTELVRPGFIYWQLPSKISGGPPITASYEVAKGQLCIVSKAYSDADTAALEAEAKEKAAAKPMVKPAAP